MTDGTFLNPQRATRRDGKLDDDDDDDHVFLSPAHGSQAFPLLDQVRGRHSSSSAE